VVSRLTLLTFVFLAFFKPAYSAEVRTIQAGDDIIVSLVGEITSGDLQKIKKIHHTNGYITKIDLDSEGGQLFEAISIGQYARENLIATEVSRGSICFSACPYILIGGIVRTVRYGATVGMHMASVSRSMEQQKIIIDILSTDRLNISEKLELIINVFEQQGAKGLLEQVFYMLDMGVSPRLMYAVAHTNHLEVYEFTRMEMRETNLITE